VHEQPPAPLLWLVHARLPWHARSQLLATCVIALLAWLGLVLPQPSAPLGHQGDLAGAAICLGTYTTLCII
jgi:cobalamin synthase